MVTFCTNEETHVPPIIGFLKCCQLLDSCFCNGVLALGKKLLVFQHFLCFSLPCNFFKIEHFKQIIPENFSISKNNSITTKPERYYHSWIQHGWILLANIISFFDG